MIYNYRSKKIKADVVGMVARDVGIDISLAEVVVQSFMDSILRTLETGSGIELRRFGVFGIRRRKAVTRCNYLKSDTERVTYPARDVFYFHFAPKVQQFAGKASQTTPLSGKEPIQGMIGKPIAKDETVAKKVKGKKAAKGKAKKSPKKLT